MSTGTLPAVPRGEYLQYGGLALIEAVMMRSPNHYAIACRAPNGEIVEKVESIEKTWIGRQKWLKWPFLRGTLAILDSMVIGNRAMKYAASVQMDPDLQPEGAEIKPQETKQKKGVGAFMEPLLEKYAIGIAVVVGLGLGFLIFNMLPNYVAELLRFAGVKNGTIINYVAEVLKMIIFLGYIYGISFMKEIRELFKYHGAEHKAINALEAEQPLTLENCRAQTRLHPRCGTSFAIIVLIVGFLFMPLVPRYPITGQQGNFLLDVPARVLLEAILLMPIAGISYELLRLAGKLRSEKWVMAAFAPGLWTQRITTKEPNEKHIEVAICALKAVLKAEGEPEPGQPEGEHHKPVEPIPPV